MSARYPGYDVLRKRSGPSWDAVTRRVLDLRMNNVGASIFFNDEERATLEAICARVVPQSLDHEAVPLAEMVEEKVAQHLGDGYRDARLPPLQMAWRTGLAALVAEAQRRYQRPFVALNGAEQEELLRCAERGELGDAAWQGMPSDVFFSERLLHDITAAYYAHPWAWNEIGFGGPASPRGYVRLGANQRDAWEAVQVRTGEEPQVREANDRVR